MMNKIRFSDYLVLSLAFLLLSGSLFSQASMNLNVLSNWDEPYFPVTSAIAYNEVWGWHDGQGREYAIIGTLAWTFFIDITDPANPVKVDSSAGGHNNCIHRDYKTYGHYAYGVA